MGGVWKRRGDPRQALLHELARGEAVGPVGEDQDDRRQAEHGLGPQRLQSGHAVHRRFERDADERLDVGGGESGRLGLDLDEWRRELREHIKRRFARGPDAKDDEHDRERHDRTRSRSAAATSARIMPPAPASASLAGTEFGAEELGRTDGHDHGAWSRAFTQDGHRIDDVDHRYAATHVDVRLTRLVHPRAAIRIVQKRRLRHDERARFSPQRETYADPLSWPEALTFVCDREVEVDRGRRRIGGWWGSHRFRDRPFRRAGIAEADDARWRSRVDVG